MPRTPAPRRVSTTLSCLIRVPAARRSRRLAAIAAALAIIGVPTVAATAPDDGDPGDPHHSTTTTEPLSPGPDDETEPGEDPGAAPATNELAALDEPSQDTAHVTVAVTPLADPPIAVDDHYATEQGISLAVEPLANDTDPSGGDLVAVLVSEPSNGRLFSGFDRITPGATFTLAEYRPDVLFVGTDTFTYQARDGHGGLSNIATVTIVVDELSSPPIAVDDHYTTEMNNGVTVQPLANDIALVGELRSAVLVDPPTNGTLIAEFGALIPGQKFPFAEYIPGAGFAGTDTFTYRAEDDRTARSDNLATVTIVVVDPDNQRPVAVDDDYTTVQDTNVVVEPLANDSDPDGDQLTGVLVSGPSHGTLSAFFVTINPGDEFVAPVYSPDAGFVGTDSFTYQARDGGGALSNVATVTIEVTAAAALATTVSVRATPNPAPLGADIELVALVEPVESAEPNPTDPTGTVSFFIDDEHIGESTLASPATLTIGGLAAGTYEVAVTYRGDDAFAGSPSAPITLVVEAAAPSSEPPGPATTVAVAERSAATPTAVPTGTLPATGGSTLVAGLAAALMLAGIGLTLLGRRAYTS